MAWMDRTRERFEANPVGATLAMALLAVMIGVVVYAFGWTPG